MKNLNEKTVKPKRFTVLENGKEVLNTSKREEADKKISQLQKELKLSIVLLDNQEKRSTRYKKTIHQKNYRVEAGDFEIDSVLPPVAEPSSTEE
ncbi:hypothetical protein [Flavobacterium sp.]|uniref:hypothetical protein n=1 Tax=Flavobacterium sp. TaxID=239 RepID=UPI002C589393|nr:hypothetical protein [Flavobacterium sp.]HSD07923.1 hypothetical protein [Flavobacterium sp.]